jgi:hypothetical protein
MKRVTTVLHYGNIALFVWLIVRALFNANLPSWLIAAGILAVGPLEDPLKDRVRRGPRPKDTPAVDVVDKATSAVLLALLVWVLYLIR